MFVAVIMAGGRGQRFWPLSTEDKPKQFLDLEKSGRTLIQSTLDRLVPLTGGVERVFVITGERYQALVHDQLPELPHENIILEPVGRDTAPAVALSALEMRARFGDVVMGLFTADHRVGNVPSFQGAVRRAISVTEQTRGLTTLGVKPTFPATGYGYIQAGAPVGAGFKVNRFVEKPDARTAEAYLQNGGYYWNNGIFVWHTSTILEEFAKHAPNILTPLEAAHAGGMVAEVFPKIEKISIDYAVLEKTDKAYMVVADYDWDDLGDWLAVERHLGKDEANTVVGAHVGLDSQGNVIYCDDENATIVTIGVEDMIIVKRGDTVLVTRKDRAQDIKSVLQRPELAKKG
ncbi:mannose-1-phosphate guanylyltransferase [Truepera radiovictrix]|uniref:mannose-1-phosphate guanylyltransferase n=1 Tax=Truepera radiovictrix (strain DSM 17093 / CIP 108686 / LMG 22925 / RQ-24) TaxID=649638 RepID=D7CVQ9_TRURR|nr:mannose-1-phosphate guanylyltransferase [Truepera radiovictrix]ADI15970.1 Mannose-1-phosphate guanylyltransferase [Truepera radiovictrix DSM 17093]WMT58405.1 mannose-1-phosphate guanylyltransferase [Truepera radiovictrix]